MDGILKKIEIYNPNKTRKLLTAFDDTTVDMLSNKKLNPIVTETFLLFFLHNILLLFPKKLTKFCALFYYQNSKQKGTSKNCI